LVSHHLRFDEANGKKKTNSFSNPPFLIFLPISIRLIWPNDGIHSLKVTIQGHWSATDSLLPLRCVDKKHVWTTKHVPIYWVYHIVYHSYSIFRYKKI
jgi:hypothetical protein